MNKGRFITIEGIEGSGKSTLIGKLKRYIEAQGYEVVMTREPGGSEIAEQIRSVILNRQNINMDGMTEALLYAAARRQHLMEKVIPAIEGGKIVLCDRFIDSSLAYQGHARGLGLDKVYAINQVAIEGCIPDITLYLDLDPEKGLARINADQNREVNRLDLEHLSFHYKVREGYQILLERFPERMFLINADQPTDDVLEEAIRVLKEHQAFKF